MFTASGGNSGVGRVTAAVIRSITSVPNVRGIYKRSDGSQSTTIILSTVLSVLGCSLVAGSVFAYVRYRRRRTQLFSRAVSPIDDDEIATWKGNRQEKELENGRTGIVAMADSKGHQKHESVGSTRKPASVIVYSNSQWSEERSPRLPSYYGKRSLDGRKMSFDKEAPSTPILARAPNAREGLTDDAVPGDDPFVQIPKRHTSRLSKVSPSIQPPRQAHTRSKSARSNFSLHSLGDHLKSYDSDVELAPQASRDQQDGPSRRKPARVFSSSSVPPRSSLSDDWPGPSKLSPTPAVAIRREDIGRAIG